MTLSELQFFLFPVAFFVMLRRGVLGERLPRPMLLLAASAFVLSAYSAFTVRGGAERIVVATFAGDPHEARTKVFRSRLDALLDFRGRTTAARYFETVRDVPAARVFLESHPDVPFLVWGSERFLRISLRREPPARLADLSPGAGAWLAPELRLVLGIEEIGMTLKPDLETAGFVASLMDAERGYRAGIENPAALDLPRVETSLRALGTSIAPWQSFAHRALPLFLLGNLHFVRGMHADTPIEADLKCSADAWQAALRLIRRNDNPELVAALYNNLGVVALVRSKLLRRPGLARVSRRFFRKAVRARAQKNLLGARLEASSVAAGNSDALRDARRSVKRKRRKHGRRS